MPTRVLARAATLLVVLALLLPAAAGAQQAPSLGAPTETQAPVVVTTSTDPGDRGLERWQELLIFGAGIILLVGIAWAIVSDARQRAPVEERHRGGEPATAGGTRLSPHDRRRRKERARARGRAARRARKQNR